MLASTAADETVSHENMGWEPIAYSPIALRSGGSPYGHIRATVRADVRHECRGRGAA